MLLLAPNDPAVKLLLQQALSDVEARFAAELVSDLPCVNELAEHVESYRGKMLRPMLVLAGGLAASPTGVELVDEHRVVATVVEMVHMSTLVHDDVLDDAQTRRGGDTLNQLRGNETAVMLGDYLISHAYHLCATIERPGIARQIAATTNIVCEGELLQLANRNNWMLDEATYFEIIRRKTASLCGVCCRLGGVLHDAPEAVVEGLSEYGQNVGVAFQIVDDLLDLTGDEQVVGKSLGRDLAKGKLTLPVIHMLRQATPAQRDDWVDRLQACATDMEADADATRALAWAMEQADSLVYARKYANTLIARAKQAVAPLPDSVAKDLLISMAEAVVTRQA